MATDPTRGHADNVVPLRRPGQAPRLFPDTAPSGEVGVGQEVEVLEGQVIGRPEGEGFEPRSAVEVVRDIIAHPAVQTGARHAAFVALGSGVVIRRVWNARSTARYQRMMDSAEVMGDHESALVWEERAALFRRDRHQRRMDWIEVPARVLAIVPQAAVVGVAGMGVFGGLLALATQDVTKVAAPFLFAAHAVEFTVTAVSLAWLPTVVISPLVLLTVLWVVGRKNAGASSVEWIRQWGGVLEEEDEPITPSIVVTALRDLGIPALRKAITEMGDAGAAMLSPIRGAGCGVEVDVTLPSGTSTQEVEAKRRKLAENMGRHEHELFITVSQRARTVRLWIADSGALDEPIGPSPLVYDENTKADYYTGRAPWGQTLRGDAATVSVFQQHVLFTGKSNQGKTASLRALALWLALDPTVEFRIADLKGVGDWGMFDGIAAELIEGPTDRHCIDTTHMLEAVVEEMDRRLEALKESGSADGVTRAMAREPGSGFHPLVVIVDEAQKAYMCPAIGEDKRPYGGKKATSRYLNAVREIKNQGRAVNVTLWEGTQDPTDENLPKISREGAHLRASLFLATESQAKMALGDAPVEQGAAPHKLRDGLDRGTVVALGPGIDIPAGQPALTIRTHFISGENAAKVADRARARRGAITTRSAPAPRVEARNLLEDLDTVLLKQSGRVRLSHLPALLCELAPDHAPYQSLTGQAIGAVLADHGIPTLTTGNRPQLDATVFRTHYARLATGQ